MYIKYLIVLLIYFCGIFTSFTQEKFEREYRLELSEVPVKALHFIEKCNFKKTVRWFAEESQDGKTYEAKSIKFKHKFSIEFDLNGDVIDVEKTIKLSHLGLNIQEKIKAVLATRFKRYKLKKIQVQWTKDLDNLLNYINNRKINYKENLFEIVIKSKIDKIFYEVLISQEGKILKELHFANDNFDNLEY